MDEIARQRYIQFPLRILHGKAKASPMGKHVPGVVLGVMLLGSVARAQMGASINEGDPEQSANPASYQPPYMPPPEYVYQYSPASNPAAYQPPYEPPPTYAYRYGPSANPAAYQAPYVLPPARSRQNDPAVRPAAYQAPYMPSPTSSPYSVLPAAVGSGPPQPSSYQYSTALVPAATHSTLSHSNSSGFARDNHRTNWQLATPTYAQELEDGTHAPETDENTRLTSFGARFGGFAFRNEVLNHVYGTLPSFGIELKRHFASSFLAASTSLDFYGGQGDPITFNSTGNSEVSSLAWRVTAVLQPQPGTWGSEDGDFYVNPHFGIGLGYYRFAEEMSVTSQWGHTFSDRSDLDGFGGHANLGIDCVFQNKFSLGCSLVSSVVNMDAGWQGNTDLGGDALFFNLDGRF